MTKLNIIFAAIIIGLHFAIVNSDNLQSGIFPQSLTFLGAVEGKSYFVDNTTYVTWFEAKEYCESMRMTLASIESPAQAEFLNNSYNANYFARVYWLSGRDSLTPSQFSWDNSNKTTDEFYLPQFEFRTEMQTCLMYHSVQNGPSKIFVYPCTVSYSDVSTLCETS